MVMKIIIDILFILVSLFFLGINIYELSKNKKKSVLYIYPIIFIFNVLPTIIHLFFGQADYYYLKFANISSRDRLSNMIYEVIMILVIVGIWAVSYYNFRHKKIEKSDVKMSLSNIDKKTFLNCMLVLQLVPIVIALVVPQYRGNFISYGARYNINGVAEIPPYIIGIGTIAFLFYLINTNKEYLKKNVLSLILMVITIYLRGSRAIIATVVAMGLYALLLSGKLKFKRAMKIVIILVPLFLLGFYIYHLLFRETAQSFYSYYSVDFSRDYTAIFSIYAKLNGIEILEYFGQSFLFCLIFWLPRHFFPWKPYPFPTYITLALMGKEISQADYLTMRTTTSIFSEAIANLGIILGTVFVLIALSWLIRFIDKMNNINYKFLLIYFGFELLTLDLANWIIPFLFMSIVILLLENKDTIYKILKKEKKHVEK